jgi:hypothetical protein
MSDEKKGPQYVTLTDVTLTDDEVRALPTEPLIMGYTMDPVPVFARPTFVIPPQVAEMRELEDQAFSAFFEASGSIETAGTTYRGDDRRVVRERARDAAGAYSDGRRRQGAHFMKYTGRLRILLDGRVFLDTADEHIDLANLVSQFDGVHVDVVVDKVRDTSGTTRITIGPVGHPLVR